MKNVLYISYDGMTDPLGQSQILPYLIQLSKSGYCFTILSCEKPQKMIVSRDVVTQLINGAGINWVYLPFTTKPRYLAKFIDVLRMKYKAIHLTRQYKFDFIHCRSYIGAGIGLYLKKRFGIEYLFDMRGLWPDEKKDSGAWNIRNPLFKLLYKYYKYQEINYLKNAAYIVSLTYRAQEEILKWNIKQSIAVIPCCADMDHFTITDSKQKEISRILLGLPKDKLVISYLGSLGSWYMIDEMLELFCQIRLRYVGSIFLFVTPSDPHIILKLLDKYDIKQAEIKIISAQRNQVPEFIKASDINISFIRPTYSKIASSPVKLAEVLAMGIPVICNSGIGDVDESLLEPDCGVVINSFSTEEFVKAIDLIPPLLEKLPLDIRNKIIDDYSLDNGVAKYLNVYNLILSGIIN